MTHGSVAKKVRLRKEANRDFDNYELGQMPEPDPDEDAAQYDLEDSGDGLSHGQLSGNR